MSVLIPSGVHIKQRIALGFDNAAKAYSQRALIQQQIAKVSLDCFSQHVALEPHTYIVDLGCGTATAKSTLSEHCEHYIGLDLSHNMLKEASNEEASDNTHHFINADAESLPLQTNSIDGFYSSMALQWCLSPQLLLAEVHRALKPNGFAMLAIMVDGSFNTLHTAWRNINMPSRVNRFLANGQWLQYAQQLPWEVTASTQTFTSQHASVANMLRSIKDAGANTQLINAQLSRPTSLSRNELHLLDKALPRDSHNHLSLDYQVMFLCLRK